MQKTGFIRIKHLIIFVDLLSDLGNQFVQFILLDMLIFKGENSGFNLLFLYILEQAPSILLSPLAGLWVDRIGAKKWLIFIGLAKCTLILMFIFTSSLWMLFSVYLVFIICSLFFYIGRLSLIPILIDKNNLISFNSLLERVSLGGKIVGPWVIGKILSKANPATAFGMAGFLFILSTCSLFRLPALDKHLHREDHEYKAAENQKLFFHWSLVFKNRNNIKVYFTFFGFALVGGGVLNFGFPLLYKAHFEKSIADWGLIIGGFQAGACLSTVILPFFSNIFRQQSIISSTFFIIGGFIAILCKTTTCFQAGLVMIPLGCGFTLLHIYLESLIQQHVPKYFLGKFLSLLSFVKGSFYLGTTLSSATMLLLFKPEHLLLAGALIMLSASFVVKRYG